MNRRTRNLPRGWYPTERAEIDRMIRLWSDRSGIEPSDAVIHAGVVPHAGWTFCGSMIWSVLSSFPQHVDTIVVLGGHSRSGASLVTYSEDTWLLPAGEHRRNSALDRSVLEELGDRYVCHSEQTPDNTVEVVMAMASVMFPDAGWSAWRIPADERAMEFGQALAEAAGRDGGSMLVVGSTDLTHYGPNFGFSPVGSRNDPVEWVKHRDMAQLEYLRSFRGTDALESANEDGTACSSGGAVAAMSYARASGGTTGRILEYRTSRDIHDDPSFVGYGTILWESPVRET